ncbi:hypothetical protein DXG01_013725, partial [Tephrocybe rancida]
AGDLCDIDSQGNAQCFSTDGSPDSPVFTGAAPAPAPTTSNIPKPVTTTKPLPPTTQALPPTITNTLPPTITATSNSNNPATVPPVGSVSRTTVTAPSPAAASGLAGNSGTMVSAGIHAWVSVSLMALFFAL